MTNNEQNLCCLRCGVEMEYIGREKFQLGEEIIYIRYTTDPKSMLLELYRCPECGKVEFFAPRSRQAATQSKPNWICSECGTYNSGRVHTCQGCGVTRAWLEEKQKKNHGKL